MNKNYLSVIFVLLFSLSPLSLISATLNVSLSDQGTGVAYLNGTTLSSGDLSVLIYTVSSGGSPTYNETFSNAISNGSWNVMLGSGSVNLPLEFGKVYYKDYLIAGEDASFDGSDRQAFYSPLGDINYTKYIFEGPSGEGGNNTVWNITTSNYLINSSGILGVNETKLDERYLRNNTNLELGANNITTTGTGFFSWLGSLINRITGLFVQDINFNGTINGSGNVVTIGNVTAGYFIGDGSQLTGVSSLWSEDVSSGITWIANTSHNVGIGTVAPSHKLEVNGNILSANFNTSDTWTYAGNEAGDNYVGSEPTLVGYRAGANSTANYLTAFGAWAGDTSVGTENTFVGYSSGYESFGNNVICMGDSSCANNIGNKVLGIGYQSGQNNLGNNTIGIGWQALYNNIANNVVAIGYEAGESNAAPNQFIVKQANINGIPLIQGNFSSGFVGIGITSPSAKLDVNGSISLTGNLTLGQKLTFALNGMIDNIVDGWIRITGGLNVTGNIITAGNATADYFIGDGSQLTGVNIITESTGLIQGGVLSTNVGDNTLIDITAGSGQIVDSTTNPDNPTLTSVSWTNITGYNLTTTAATGDVVAIFLSLDSSGNVVERLVLPTSEERRDTIDLGIIGRNDTNHITFAGSGPLSVVHNPTSQLQDFFQAWGAFNVEGNQIEPNTGADLQIKKLVGSVFRNGANFQTDGKNPHIVDLAEQAPAYFNYKLSDGTDVTFTADIDPNNYDDGTSTIATVSNNQWTVQLVSVFASGLVEVLYGQEVFASESDAVTVLSTIDFTIPTDSKGAVPLAYLVLQQGDTILPEDRFYRITRGGTAGGGGAIYSAGTGIEIINSLINLNTTYTDDRYVNIDGDNMTGNLNMTSNNITAVDCITFVSGGKICNSP